MASYRLVVRASVKKDLRGLPTADVVRIMERIAKLADEPRPAGCEKLSLMERYRTRQGDYRIIYSTDDCEVTVWVVKVGHRRDVCRQR
jgi:mRNA interferase RelE/StbE